MREAVVVLARRPARGPGADGEDDHGAGPAAEDGATLRVREDGALTLHARPGAGASASGRLTLRRAARGAAGEGAGEGAGEVGSGDRDGEERKRRRAGATGAQGLRAPCTSFECRESPRGAAAAAGIGAKRARGPGRLSARIGHGAADEATVAWGSGEELRIRRPAAGDDGFRLVFVPGGGETAEISIDTRPVGGEGPGPFWYGGCHLMRQVRSRPRHQHRARGVRALGAARGGAP